MRVEKKVIGHLNKCYCVAPLLYRGESHFLVAAEKDDPCLLFDQDGVFRETVWERPGGVMSIVQVPGSDGQFLSTRKFYSPNDSKEARIEIVTPQGGGRWEARTLAELPFVHRFDILRRNGRSYLLACALKSGYEGRDDWSQPGRVFAAELPGDLSGYGDGNYLPLEVLKDRMLKNHGYTRFVDGGVETGLVSCDNGIYQFIPPAQAGGGWEIRTILEEAASDAVLTDLDGDGEPELALIAPFHGDRFRIYKKREGAYRKVYEHEAPMEFLHAIYGGDFCGKPAVIVGHREGKRELAAFTYDSARQAYEKRTLDIGPGFANIMRFQSRGKDVLVSANREANEIAIYYVEDF